MVERMCEVHRDGGSSPPLSANTKPAHYTREYGWPRDNPYILTGYTAMVESDIIHQCPDKKEKRAKTAVHN